VPPLRPLAGIHRSRVDKYLAPGRRRSLPQLVSARRVNGICAGNRGEAAESMHAYPLASHRHRAYLHSSSASLVRRLYTRDLAGAGVIGACSHVGPGYHTGGTSASLPEAGVAEAARGLGQIGTYLGESSAQARLCAARGPAAAMTFPGIIGLGRVHRVRYSLAVRGYRAVRGRHGLAEGVAWICGEGMAWIPLGQETPGESGPMC